jgi:hypothetical protein
MGLAGPYAGVGGAIYGTYFSIFKPEIAKMKRINPVIYIMYLIAWHSLLFLCLTGPLGWFV